MYIQYTNKRFSARSLELIANADSIIRQYNSQGYTLTLRQLYYQFVSRDILENSQRSYKSLGALISNARLAGLLDWEGIEDRTRWLRSNSHWDTPAGVIDSARRSYRIDMWENQPKRVEVWIEKDALVGVIENVCDTMDVPYFACRGYPSQSEVWRAARRFSEYVDAGQTIHIIHLGDHDPSGIDMTRDLEDRLEGFDVPRSSLEIDRVALNMYQIEELKPPPNPTKLTDSRADGYISRFGYSSWELDALEPVYISNLIQERVDHNTDLGLWIESEDRLNADVATLDDIVDNLEK